MGHSPQDCKELDTTKQPNTCVTEDVWMTVCFETFISLRIL